MDDNGLYNALCSLNSIPFYPNYVFFTAGFPPIPQPKTASPVKVAAPVVPAAVAASSQPAGTRQPAPAPPDAAQKPKMQRQSKTVPLFLILFIVIYFSLILFLVIKWRIKATNLNFLKIILGYKNKRCLPIPLYTPNDMIIL